MDRVRIAAVATMIALSGPVFAQQPAASPLPPVDFSKVEIKSTALGDNCYMLQGEGGNITVAVAKDGIIMVDGQYAPLHDRIRAAIEAISKQPIKYLINTSFHGDTYVWFKTANVLSTGDTFTNRRYPDIDFANGGHIDGMIAASDAYLKLANARTRIVPGHGPLADRAALVEYRTMLVTARDRMTKLVKERKSEDEVVAAKPFADLDPKWAPTELASKNFIRVVYHSLADKSEAKRPSFRRFFRRS